jgi:hypothetical protein
MMRVSLCAAFAVLTFSCAAPGNPKSPLTPPTRAEWQGARERLADLQAKARGEGPRTMRLSLKLREPYTQRTLEARGAVAIAPPDALRMILLGPGGSTALDLWARGDRFRFAVPALDLVRRGDASTPRAAMRGLPVDFLRWWMLRPASGKLLWHRAEADGERFYLRDGAAIIELFASRGGSLWARRTTWGEPSPGAASRLLDEEIVEADHVGCGSARYRQASTGLFISVVCEGEETARAPSARAFADPDAPQQDMGDGT